MYNTWNISNLYFLKSRNVQKLVFSNMWPDLTKAGFHTHIGKVDFSPPLDFYINELTIHVCIIAIVSLAGLLFLGLVSWVCLMCLSARVVFKWQWCKWTSTHLAGNRHMTGQKAWPSNWLLYVTFRAQMGLRWDLLAVSTSTVEEPTTSVAPHRPWPSPLWSFVIVV